MTGTTADLSATELLAAYRSGELSPVRATQDALDRAEKLNPEVNAYCLLDPAGAIEAAKASEERWRRGEPMGILDGVPTSIKDILLTVGWPTLRGSKTVNPDGPWRLDGPPVARVKEEGAVLLGKTTTPELAWKGVTDSPLYGVTGNPWNPQLTAGGSSGGAAAAVGLGMGPLSLGTDGGGSVPPPWQPLRDARPRRPDDQDRRRLGAAARRDLRLRRQGRLGSRRVAAHVYLGTG
jgi:aspartyl-tRNA(Asn)/glutamyl-tRNA(Gln) amidotransferase subunit A